MKLFKKTPLPSSRRQRIQYDREAAPRAKAFSYRAKRSNQNINTGRNTQREIVKPTAQKLGYFWLQRFGQFVLLIVLVVCTVNVLSLSDSPRIVILPSIGETSFLHSDSTYQQAAAKLFAASIWNRNKITVNTSSISRQMNMEFPELDETSITLPLLAHRPLVYLQPAEPSLIYRVGNDSYVLDSHGKALFRLGDTSLSLPILTSQNSLIVHLNQQILTGNDVNFIRTIEAELAARHITTSSLVLPPNSRELDAYINGQPYFVKFNLQNNDPRQQAGTFLAVQANLQSQHITPAHYIDVRVDGRAYYL